MAISTDWTGWVLADNLVGSCCNYYEADTGKFIATLTFEFAIEPGLGGLSVSTFLLMKLEPFVTQGELNLILFLGRGTSVGKFFPVRVDSGNGPSAAIRFSKREDVLEVVKALTEAVDLRFILKGPSEDYADLPVPNNSGFRDLYDHAYRAVASSGARSEERAGDVMEGIMSDPIQNLLTSLDHRLTLHETPFDPELMRQAEAKCGYDLKAVGEEYNRLILKKYHKPQLLKKYHKPQGSSFWSRLFG